MQILVASFTMGFVLNTSAVALADKSIDEQAKTAFDKGKELFHKKEYAEAAEAFSKAYNLKKTWKLLYNIGQSEASAKRHGLALEAFEQYLAEGGDDVPVEKRDYVISEVKRLREMVGSLDVHAPEGALVIVDGVERGTAPLVGPLTVAAGMNHNVLVKHLEDKLLDRVVRVRSGQTLVVESEAISPAPDEDSEEESKVTVSIPQEAKESDEAVSTPTDREERRQERMKVSVSPLFWVGLAGTVAVGAVSGVFWGLQSSRKKDYEKELDVYYYILNHWDAENSKMLEAENSSYKALESAQDEAKLYNGLAVGLTIATGALAAATVVTLFIKWDDEEESPVEVTAVPGGMQVRF